MAETIKCTCSHCGAKYRLPVEAQGRTARCKRCGEKFSIPREESLEDSILTWLNAPTEAEPQEDTLPDKPRVISMPVAKEDPSDGTIAGRRIRGSMRMKTAEEESA